MSRSLRGVRRRRLPNVNVAAAMSISQGSRRRKLESDVRTSSSAPASPPATLASAENGQPRRDVLMSPRYANVLDTDAGHSASVDVALATTGDTPATMSAGSVRNDRRRRRRSARRRSRRRRTGRRARRELSQSAGAAKRRSHPAVDDPARDRTGARRRRHDRRPGVAVRRHDADDPPRSAGARRSRLPALRRSIARRRPHALGASTARRSRGWPPG